MGPEYLLLLQMFLPGEVEYVPVPLIIFRQRQSAPIRPPMYLEAAFHTPQHPLPRADTAETEVLDRVAARKLLPGNSRQGAFRGTDGGHFSTYHHLYFLVLEATGEGSCVSSVPARRVAQC